MTSQVKEKVSKTAKKKMETICENLDDEVKEKLYKSKSEKKISNLWESGW